MKSRRIKHKEKCRITVSLIPHAGFLSKAAEEFSGTIEKSAAEWLADIGQEE